MQLQLQRKDISLVTHHPSCSSDGAKVAWQVRTKDDNLNCTKLKKCGSLSKCEEYLSLSGSLELSVPFILVIPRSPVDKEQQAMYRVIKQYR